MEGKLREKTMSQSTSLDEGLEEATLTESDQVLSDEAKNEEGQITESRRLRFMRKIRTVSPTRTVQAASTPYSLRVSPSSINIDDGKLVETHVAASDSFGSATTLAQ